MKKEKKKPIIKWDNILSPEEMKEMFDQQYGMTKTRDGDIYVNSKVLVEELAKDGTEDVNELVKMVPTVYLCLVRKYRKFIS